MERPRLIPQIYGYAVCLVCVITILIATSSTIGGLFDTVSPEMSREVVMNAPMVRPMTPDQSGQPVIPDSVQRARQDEERAERIAFVRYHGLRTVVTSGLILLLAAGLFVGHWRWLRGLSRAETA